MLLKLSVFDLNIFASLQLGHFVCMMSLKVFLFRIAKSFFQKDCLSRIPYYSRIGGRLLGSSQSPSSETAETLKKPMAFIDSGDSLLVVILEDTLASG